MTSFQKLIPSLACVLLVSCALKSNPEERPLVAFGRAEAAQLRLPLKLLNWNVLKGKRAAFASEYARLAEGADLITLQEMSTQPVKVSGRSASDAVVASGSVGMQMVSVLKYPAGFAGVATGSRACPLAVLSMPSADPEQGVSWRKSSLITSYRLEGKHQTLMVANTHGLNLAGKAFFSQRRFDVQVEEVADVLATHRGPLIWVGDFNTHDKAKTQALTRQTERLGLERVPVEGSRWLMRSPIHRLELDHVYLRGLKVRSAHSEKTKGSDHAPILLEVTW
jgi:endonuclease/exonuclease/phosphatase (EEP) superfamily protein YafD